MDKLTQQNHFFLTWGISENHGGMTIALIDRAKLLRKTLGINIDILCFEQNFDFEKIRNSLYERYGIGDGIKIRSMWNEVAEYPAFPLNIREKLAKFKTALSVYEWSTESHSQGKITKIKDKKGKSVAYLLERKNREFAFGVTENIPEYEKGGISWSPEFDLTESWTGHYSLYKKWLDKIRRNEDSIVTIDSKTAANFAINYDRHNVRKIYIMHGSHKDKNGSQRVSPSRHKAISNAAKFDSMVFMSDHQREDFFKMVGPIDNACVIPNHKDPCKMVSTANRSKLKGVVVASLTNRKQVEQAIEAVDIARRATGLDIKLDIIGDGPNRDSLIDLINKSSLEKCISLKGYIKNPQSLMRGYSFILFTSRSESFGLVLVEAMYGGCIPISYDIEFGPRSIISHGTDGFICGSSPKCIANTLIDFLKMNIWRRSKMRNSAKRKANSFSGQKISSQWLSLFEKISHDRVS